MKVLYYDDAADSAVVLGESGALFLVNSRNRKVKTLDPVLFATWLASIVGLDSGVTEAGWDWLQSHLHLVYVETSLN